MSASNSSYPGAMPPPAGQTANLNAPAPSVQKAWIAALVVELGVPTIFLLIRVYVRGRLVKVWTWSDWSFLVAWALFVTQVGLGLSLLRYGIGRPAWDIAPAKFSKFAKNLNIQRTIYQPAIAFAKNSLLLQLLEIFVPGKSGGRYWTLVGLIILNCIFFTVTMFLVIFECSPRKKIWEPDVRGHCNNMVGTSITIAAINVTEDFIILALPMYWVWRVQIAMKMKFKGMVVFAAGLFACACSVVRLVETAINASNPDISKALVPVSLWAGAEVSSGLVVACFPYLPKLVEKRSTSSQGRWFNFERFGLWSSPQPKKDREESESNVKLEQYSENRPESRSSVGSTLTGFSQSSTLPGHDQDVADVTETARAVQIIPVRHSNAPRLITRLMR